MGSDSTQFRSAAYCPFPTFGHCAAQPVSATLTSRQADAPGLLPPAPPLVAEAAGRGTSNYLSSASILRFSIMVR